MGEGRHGGSVGGISFLPPGSLEQASPAVVLSLFIQFAYFLLDHLFNSRSCKELSCGLTFKKPRVIFNFLKKISSWQQMARVATLMIKMTTSPPSPLPKAALCMRAVGTVSGDRWVQAACLHSEKGL